MRGCWPCRRSKSAGHDSAWNRFVHQELKGYSPIMTGNRVLAFFLLATIVLIPLGAAILAASLSVTEYKIRYDNVGTGFDSSSKTEQQQTLWSSNTGSQTVNFTTTKRLKAPVSGILGHISTFPALTAAASCILACCRCLCTTSCKASIKITRGELLYAASAYISVAQVILLL